LPTGGNRGGKSDDKPRDTWRVKRKTKRGRLGRKSEGSNKYP